jgi:hypothetical protein
MRVTYCNLKPIVKGSGPYHEIRWNVETSTEQQGPFGHTVDTSGCGSSMFGRPLQQTLRKTCLRRISALSVNLTSQTPCTRYRDTTDSFSHAHSVSESESRSHALSRGITQGVARTDSYTYGVNASVAQTTSKSITTGRPNTSSRSATESCSEEEGWNQGQTLSPFLAPYSRRIPTSRTYTLRGLRYNFFHRPCGHRRLLFNDRNFCERLKA